MCDTIFAPPASTASGSALFGKNSDRQRNEAAVIEAFPGREHEPDATSTCTYIAIPEVRRTNAIILSRPFWMWGAEMGANEHGVMIGNEALHARVPAREDRALLGDDLVRLALERASSAAEAVDVIIELLETWGQGGNNGHIAPSHFNNGFMIADASGAFVLETIGRDWLLERVSGVRSMSNRYSIASGVVRSSDGLADVLAEFGWQGDRKPENYSEILANPNREHLGYAGARRACTMKLLGHRDGDLNILDMMAILRDHGTGDQPQWRWAQDGFIRKTVCMHAGAVDSTGQSTASMVSDVRLDSAIHWVTGTSAPCISIFKPVFVDAFPSRNDLNPTDRFDPGKMWWRHEAIHRQLIVGDFAGFLESVHDERDQLEAIFHERANAVRGGDTADRGRVVNACWREAEELEQRWKARLALFTRNTVSPEREGWQVMNELAGLPADWAGAA